VIPIERPYWNVLTIVVKPDMGSVFARAVQRGAGTVVGVVVGAALLAAVPPGAPVILTIAILSGLLPLAMRRNYGLLAAFITPLVVMLIDLATGVGGSIVLPRLEATLIGCAVVLVLGYLLWPQTWRTRAGARISGSIDALAAYLETAFGTDEAERTTRRRDAYCDLSGARCRAAAHVLRAGRRPETAQSVRVMNRSNSATYHMLRHCPEITVRERIHVVAHRRLTGLLPATSFLLLTVGALGATSVAQARGTATAPARAAVKTTSAHLLVSSSGMTLYVFAPDSKDKSTCYGECAKFWPPYLVKKGAKVKSTVSGIPGSFGVAKRTDGTRQLTYDGAPLYMFAGDHSAGDINGQGVFASGGFWWAVVAAGH
jgi:predicted lipoprotein with Yx(FWY)xxD motif